MYSDYLIDYLWITTCAAIFSFINEYAVHSGNVHKNSAIFGRKTQ